MAITVILILAVCIFVVRWYAKNGITVKDDWERIKEKSKNPTPTAPTPTSEYAELMQLKSDLEHGRPVLTQPKKDASVVGRAVIGGAIAGPTGAVVGALSAVDKNNKNAKK